MLFVLAGSLCKAVAHSSCTAVLFLCFVRRQNLRHFRVCFECLFCVLIAFDCCAMPRSGAWYLRSLFDTQKTKVNRENKTKIN